MEDSLFARFAGALHRRALGFAQSLMAILLLTCPLAMAADDETTIDVSTLEKIAAFEFGNMTALSGKQSGNSIDNSSYVTVTTCSVAWSNVSNPSSSSNYQVINEKYYYKLESGATVCITLTDGKFQQGDVLTIDVCANSAGKSASYYIKSSDSSNKISVTCTTTGSAYVAYYTLTSDDINDDGSITLVRDNSEARLHGAAIYRKPTQAVKIATEATEVEANETFTITATTKNIDESTSVEYQWYKASSATADTESDTKIDNATTSTLTTWESTTGTYYYYCTATYTTTTTSSDDEESSEEQTEESVTSTDDSSDTSGDTTTDDSSSDSSDSSDTSGSTDDSSDGGSSDGTTDGTSGDSSTDDTTTDTDSSTSTSTTVTLTSNVVSVTVVSVKAATIATTSTEGETATTLTATTTTDASNNSIDLYYIDATGAATITATATNNSTQATLYYYTGSAISNYTTGENTGWTAYPTSGGIAISITDSVSYLTVAAVVTTTTNGSTSVSEVAYTYAKYAYDLNSGTLSFDKNSALSTVAISNESGYALGVKVLYTPTNAGTSTDVTSKVGLTYTSGDETIATVGSDGTVKGVSVGTVSIQAKLTHAGNYTVSKKDTTSVTVNVVASEVPVIALTEESAALSYTKDGNAYRFSGEDVTSVTVTVSVPSTAESDNYQIFYTLDGSIPTTKSAKIESGSKLTINITSYLFAVLYKKTTTTDGSTTYSDPGSVVMASFHLPTTKTLAFSDGMTITPGGTMKIEYVSSDGTTSPYIIATFGSTGDSDVWETTDQDNKMLGSELGSFHYAAVGLKDASNEPSTLYKSSDVSRYNPEVSGGTNEFDIPINGSYIKFEPKQDGDVNVVVRQNGVIADDKKVDNTNASKRYVYVCDERGQAVDSLKALINPNALMNTDLYTQFNGTTVTKGTTNYSEEFLFYQKLVRYKYMEKLGYVYKDKDQKEMTTFSADNWAEDSIRAAKCFWYGSNDGDTLKYTKGDDGTITYSNVGDTIHTALKEMPYNILYKDGKGWLVMSKAYVRYSFPVEAGKTYFIMGRGTKIGPCGFSFHPRRTAEELSAFVGSSGSERLITINGTAAYGKEGAPTALTEPTSTSFTVSDSTYAEQYGQYNVQLNRGFDANVWTSLVLPFSVSPSMVEEAFGKGTEIIHFNGTSGDTLFLMKHFHQMIVAGTPVFIKPTSTIAASTGIKFEGVTYGQSTFGRDDNDLWYVKSVSSPVSATAKEDSNNWEINCSYLPAQTGSNVYLMAYKKTTDDSGNVTTSDNSLYHYTSAQKLAGTRAWLEYTGTNSSESSARLTSVAFNNLDELDDDEATAILNVALGMESAATYKDSDYIYNVNGQIVRKASEGTAGLPKGIYVINGKKICVR